MSNGIFNVPQPINEPILNYTSGSAEKLALKAALKTAKSYTADIPMVIDGKEVRTGNKVAIHPPHEIKHLLGNFHKGNTKHVNEAINAALRAKKDWQEMPFEARASIFLKAADLLAGPYRAKVNAASMLCQSKNVFQAEIDAACELIDFLRFNVYFAQELYKQQPYSPRGIWNRMEFRPLEGFVFALTPFNFASIAGNLPTSAALMGNTVVWKPAMTTVYSAHAIMEVLQAAGLPDGVINLIYTGGVETGNIIFNHPEFAGIHFTGSTEVFQSMWGAIGGNIHKYRSYPRIVGETGGKDFVLAHSSADVKVLATALSRGAFEYQGQKCSAASRAYIPESIWKATKEHLLNDIASFKMGSVEDFRNFINAVIDEQSFDKIANYIDNAQKSKDAKIIAGGTYNKSKGYFISPTVIKAKDPKYVSMCEEIFGPVLSIHVYDDNKFNDILKVIDTTSPYALTGSIISQDRAAIEKAMRALSQSAGNFYINDKPTGAVVGQQPFGGARGSGTNDKAGSFLNLVRWTSARSIKENFVPHTDYRYPFMNEA
jgi:1-pyrroline-5-carboxylate dehydrogenase